MTRRRLVLWLIGVPCALLASCWFGLVLLLGHNSYVVSGVARVPRDATVTASFPALICVGKGGPLETSGVYANPLGLEQDPAVARVLCRRPAADLTVGYTASVYSNTKPRHMHAYVWLEYHTELEDFCRSGAEQVDVSPKTVSGYGAESPVEWPCHRPLPGAVLGYAVALTEFFSGTKQHADLELAPNGYPASRSVAR